MTYQVFDKQDAFEQALFSFAFRMVDRRTIVKRLRKEFDFTDAQADDLADKIEAEVKATTDEQLRAMRKEFTK